VFTAVDGGDHSDGEGAKIRPEPGLPELTPWNQLVTRLRGVGA
jgi:hypothetical protein